MIQVLVPLRTHGGLEVCRYLPAEAEPAAHPTDATRAGLHVTWPAGAQLSQQALLLCEGREPRAVLTLAGSAGGLWLLCDGLCAPAADPPGQGGPAGPPSVDLGAGSPLFCPGSISEDQPELQL